MPQTRAHQQTLGADDQLCLCLTDRKRRHLSAQICQYGRPRATLSGAHFSSLTRPPSPSPSPPTVPLVSLYAAIINRHRRRRRRSLVLEPPLTRDEPRALGSLHNDFWIRTGALFIGAETARQRGPRRRSRGRFDAASRAVRIVSLSAFLDLFRGTRAAIS